MCLLLTLLDLCVYLLYLNLENAIFKKNKYLFIELEYSGNFNILIKYLIFD